MTSGLTQKHSLQTRSRIKMKYLYDRHLGGLYTSDEELDYDYLYCEQCGDSDTLIGSFSTIQDFWNLIKEECDINGSGGYSLQYVYPILVSEFDLPDNVRYENDYERDCGFCCNSEREILTRIEELVKEKENEQARKNNFENK